MRRTAAVVSGPRRLFATTGCRDPSDEGHLPDRSLAHAGSTCASAAQRHPDSTYRHRLPGRLRAWLVVAVRSRRPRNRRTPSRHALRADSLVYGDRGRVSETTARLPDAPFSPTPSRADSLAYVVGGCVTETIRDTRTPFGPPPPQPIRSVASPPRSSLARAREAACGDLARRAPPASGRVDAVGRGSMLARHIDARRKPTASAVGGIRRPAFTDPYRTCRSPSLGRSRSLQGTLRVRSLRWRRCRVQHL